MIPATFHQTSNMLTELEIRLQMAIMLFQSPPLQLLIVIFSLAFTHETRQVCLVH